MATQDQKSVVSQGVEAYEVPTVRKNRGMISMRLTLAAGVAQQVGVAGDYFHVLTAPVNDLQARFDEDKQTPVYEGVGFRRYYDRIELESATGQTVVVLVGFGSVADGRASANVNVSATVEPGNTNDDGGDVACPAGGPTLLAAADPDRLYALIANPSANTESFRIGSGGVGATSGALLEPGTTLPYPSTAAIYAYNTGSTEESLSVASIKRV